LIAKVVEYKARSDLPKASEWQHTDRESSPIAGIELYDYADGLDKNIAQVMIDEGLVAKGDFTSKVKTGSNQPANETAQAINNVSDNINDVPSTSINPNDTLDKYSGVSSPKPEYLETIEESPININPPIPEIPEIPAPSTVKVPVSPVSEKSNGLPTILERNEFETKFEEIEPEKKPEVPESVPVIEPELNLKEDEKIVPVVEPTTIAVTEPETEPEIKEEKVPEVMPEKVDEETDGGANSSMESNGIAKPENVPEPNLPVNSFNGNPKKSKNKKKVLNDFLSNERGNTSTKSQRAGNLKGKDWNDMMDE
jgi:hypothetical protein